MATQRTLTLTQRQRQELEDQRDHHPAAYVRERCSALLKVANGQAAHAVAQQGLLKPRDPDAIYGWLDFYEAEGMAGLLAHRRGTIIGGRFDDIKELTHQLQARPGEAARQAMGVMVRSPAQSRQRLTRRLSTGDLAATAGGPDGCQSPRRTRQRLLPH